MNMRSILIIFALLITSNVYAFDVPPADGFVTDIAGVLTASEEQALEIDLQNYKGETSNEIGILIVNTVGGEAISQVAVDVGRAWGVGSKANDNGILILIAIEDRDLFIATGYGLEGAVPDLAAKHIIENQITPEFKNGNYIGGIMNGVAALKAQIGGEYDASDADAFGSIDELPGAFWIFIAVIGFFVFFMVYQFFIGVLISVAPSRSWWEGGFLGAMFGFFFGGLAGMVILAGIGIATDFLASMLYVKYKPFREFLQKQKKKQKKGEGMWFIGGGRGGRGGGGGGGGFSGGSFGGGGAGGSW